VNERRATYLACADIAVAFLETPALDNAWARPSTLEGYTSGALAGHLLRGLLTVEQYLASATPGPGDAALDAATYFRRALGDEHPVTSSLHEGVRARSAELAGADAGALRARAVALLAGLHERLPAAPEDLCVTVFGGMSMALDDYLDTRVVELLVHLDDLAASLGLDMPPVPPRAGQRAIAVLADLAARRHGLPAVLRTFARAERAPGSISAL
jgi:uncharacterized protein (TIGR03083 family)